jgi:hypothetical protein
MERTKKGGTSVPESEPGAVKLRYRKIGGGSLRLSINGQPRIIKSGEVFSALPSEIPQAFKDTIIPLDPEKAALVSKPPVPAKVSYEIKPRGKSKSLFDVIDGQGKVMNTQPLAKGIAEQLISDLAK